METISIMMAALSCMILAEAILVWYLHRKIGYYKRLKAEREELDKKTFESLQAALRAIRRFKEKFYPEGQPRLDMAAYSLSQYIKHINWLAAKQAEGNESIERSVEESKLNEIIK